MAAEDRAPAQHLTFLAAAGERVRSSGLFPLVRGAEARAQSLPRVGKSKRPDQNVVDLKHVPTFVFPGSTLESVAVDAGRAKVSGYWFGLTGPMGPLPAHLTEYAVYERKYAKTQPFGDFLDLLAGRMLQLYYRSWADSQPAAHADRAQDDQFAFYLAALSGAAEGVAADAKFPARARLHYAGLFAGRRSAAALEDALTHLLRVDARIQEFQPRWRRIDIQDQSRLGQQFATLGSDLVAGQRVRIASDAFRVVIRTHEFAEFEALLPCAPRFAIAAEALDAFAPSHLEWDLMLEIDDSLVPPAKLDGRSRLGWTSWLQPTGTAGLRSDAHLSRQKRRRVIERFVQ
jgi:type VI secretion system ImpH/TssG family protein